jgi:uncharacterized membrane protein YphA (DoxX/SURF4 family)
MTQTLSATPQTHTIAPSGQRSSLYWLGTLGGVVLGAVLLVAVYAKALDPAAFAGQIHAEGLDGWLSSWPLALLALALEAGLGLALVLGVRRVWVLVPATLLVAFFLFLTGRAWWLAAHGLRAADTSCGCFGNLIERTPSQAFWQDLLMLVPALMRAWIGRPRQAGFPAGRTAVAVLAAIAVALFAWKAPALPLDDLATRLKPGVDIASICAGSGADKVCLPTLAPDLKTGEHLVVMADLADPATGGAVSALNGLKSRGTDVRMLSASTPEQHQMFFWQWGPTFKVVEAPPALLRPLYRALPRSFRVRDGKVTETFAGLPGGLPSIAAPAVKPAG